MMRHTEPLGRDKPELIQVINSDESLRSLFMESKQLARANSTREPDIITSAFAPFKSINNIRGFVQEESYDAYHMFNTKDKLYNHIRDMLVAALNAEIDRRSFSEHRPDRIHMPGVSTMHDIRSIKNAPSNSYNQNLYQDRLIS